MRLGRALACGVAIPLLSVAAIGCSSDIKTTSGTETFTSGKVTNSNVLESNSPILPLDYTGVVKAVGQIDLGGSGPVKGQMKEFDTDMGVLMLQVVSDSNSSKWINKKTCLGQMVTTVYYTVVGDKSTGSWKDAKGSGKVVVTFQANSELKGKCSLAQNAQPSNLKNAYAEFTGSGPMTVNL